MKRLIVVVLILASAGSVWMVLHRFGAFPYWIVFGHVIDVAGHPVENATVIAHLGLGADSNPAVTGTEGTFVVRLGVPTWGVCKGGPPSISVTKPGFQAYWSYYKPWSWGPRFTRVNIMLQSL